MVESSKDTHEREENKRLIVSSGHSISSDKLKIGGVLNFTKNPAYLQERLKIFNEVFSA